MVDRRLRSETAYGQSTATMSTVQEISFNKKHTITNCERNKERKRVEKEINISQPFNVNNLLYFDMVCNTKTRDNVTNYIISTSRACGNVIVIEKNIR